MNDDTGWRRGCAAWAGLASLLLVACGREAAEPSESGATETAVSKRNLLVVTLDTTRRDAVGFMGRTPSPTPHLDALAEQSVIFDDAYTVVPLTLPTHASLFTGLYPSAHGVRENGVFHLADEAETLAESLAAEGYDTAATVASFVLDEGFGIAQGFASYEGPARVGGLDGGASRRAGVVVDQALERLGTLREPWCFWLHLYDPHFPYDAPGSEARETTARYHEEVGYADTQLGRLFEALRLEAGREDLVVLFASDHGEALDGRKEPSHGHFVYDVTMRIPAFLYDSTLPPRRVEETVSIVDFYPTLLARLGVEETGTDLDGIDLSPWMRGDAEGSIDRAVALESYNLYVQHGWAPFESVVRGPWKYVRSAREELYDRRDDPDELRDHVAAGTVPDEAPLGELRAALEAWFGRRSSLAAAAEPLGGAEAAKLRALGYLHGDASRGASRPDDPSSLPDGLQRKPTLDRIHGVTAAILAERYDEALALTEALVADEPASAQLRDQLGAAYLTWSQDVDAARAQLEKAVELQPSLASARDHLGQCFQAMANRANRSALASRQANDLEAMNGHLADERRHRKRAREEFRAAVALEPRAPEPRARLATALARVADQAARGGKTDRAKSHFDEAIDHLAACVAMVDPSDDRTVWEGTLTAWREARARLD